MQANFAYRSYTPFSKQVFSEPFTKKIKNTTDTLMGEFLERSSPSKLCLLGLSIYRHPPSCVPKKTATLFLKSSNIYYKLKQTNIHTKQAWYQDKEEEGEAK